jgi:hypothetical protein
MAYTITALDNSVFGNKKVTVIHCLADAATAAIPTGLSKVDFVTVTPKSMTAQVKLALNAGPSATFIAGSIGVSGATSGDEFWVTCYGN